MHWTQLLLPLLLVLTRTSSKEIESNDIAPAQTTTNVDPDQLRKALLRALTELENEGQGQEESAQEGKSKTIYYTTTARTESDKIVEKASASAISIFGTTTTEKNPSTQKPLVVIQKSSGVQHRPIISVLSEEQNDEAFVASASGGFADDSNNYVKLDNYKAINKNSVSVNDKSFTAGIKSVSITPKPEATTAIPTSSTEENEAKVEDVQFFSAPLVAAFTVHQDERGLPKKVEPIYKPTATVSPRQQKQELTQQLDLHEKQKLLEQEIFKLQQEKSQQDYLLRQQQLLLQQQQRFSAVQSQTERPFIPIINPIQSTLPTFTTQFSNNQFLNHNTQFSLNNHNQFLQNQAGKNQNQNKNQFSAQNQINQIVPSIQLNQFNPVQNQFKTQTSNFSPVKKFNTLVSLQPSLSVNPTSSLPLNAQILPIKNAVEFRPAQNYNQFLTPPVQQGGGFGKFQNFQNNFVQSLPQVQHNTRVFRQEPHVGNLGFNQYQPQYNQFQSAQNNRFFRSNLEGFHSRPQNQFNQPQNVNQHLNNLLYHSGITRNIRQNDDLNIVSKILSYNVGRDNYYSGSRVSEQRLVPKV